MSKARFTLALVVLSVAGSAGCAGPGLREAEVETADGPVAVVAPPVAQADLDSFDVIDNATWLGIHAAPADAAGRRVVVHAYVMRNYATLGGGTLQVRVSTACPAGPEEGLYAVLRGDPALIGAADVGTVLRVHAEVTGAYAGSTGRGVAIPELAVHAAEDVGRYDLTADVSVGPPQRGEGLLLVPVRVRNSSDAVLIYRLELAATSADGRSVQAAVAPQVPALAPGATATMDVLLEPASPDAVAVLTGASRFVPPPGT